MLKANLRAAWALASGRSWRRHDGGSTAIEYALIAGIIALALIIGMATLGTSLEELFAGIVALIPAGE